MHHRLICCKNLVRAEYVKRHSKKLAVKWAVENGPLPEDKKWYKMNGQHGRVIRIDGKNHFWDCFKNGMYCTKARPKLERNIKEKNNIN